ncbi:putative bifunctional diguanylate cyclase/phosphodiesterase [Antrihabitans spumae]|uniref:Bifunctional diguanylate cyclase/phosphodiesterase n=1 Tax=Antrihabitans spumae TaxID=3373370 RepID=A0ABW7K277_9NOCA
MQMNAQMADRSSAAELSELVISIGQRLLASQATTAIPVIQEILHELREFFGVDHTCLRYTDHTIRASLMVAESPVRESVPDPDPMACVYFEGADEVFAQAEHSVVTVSVRPGDGSAKRYQEQVREVARLAWGEEAVAALTGASVLATPLVVGPRPVGFVSLTKFGDMVFTADEVEAMNAIASMLTQLKSRIEAEESLIYSTMHDDLTNLSNRRALIGHLEERLQTRQPGLIAFFLDVDRLKTINDFLGHDAGDRFIRVIAKRLKDHSEPRDMIARLGGDEFIIVPAQPMSFEIASKHAERLRKLVSARVSIGAEPVSRTVSIGVTMAEAGDTASDVMRRADQAMLAAKAAGGNEVAVFTDEMRKLHALRDDVEFHLGSAIQNDALTLHYQPEVDLRSGRILGVEALVRWQHPSRGLLLPESFVGTAESANLAGALNRWVVRRAAEQWVRWRDAGIIDDDFGMRVNVSPVQLVSVNFVDDVATIVSDVGIDPKALCIEITEHVLVQDLDRARVTLEALKHLGLKTAIDDFGTGYSSFTHLKQLEVDQLKIDRSFIQKLGRSPDDLAIVTSIVDLAESFDMSVVAEGLETQIGLETLLSVGCTRAQGRLLAPPTPVEDVTQVLADRVIDLGPR